MLESLWKMMYNLKLRFRKGVFTIHHVSSCTPSIWQDGGGIPDDSNVVFVPLQIRSYDTYY
jgi:hypothetical protein